MARARSSGAAAAWGLVIFAMGFGICLILAIVFYTQLRGAQDDQKKANKILREVVSAAQENSPEVQGARSGDKTVVGFLLEENHLLKRMISGDPALTAEAIAEDKKRRGIEFALIRHIESLEANLDEEKKRADQAEQNREEARTRAADAERTRDDLRSKYDESVASMVHKITDMETQLNDYRGKGGELVNQFTRQFGELRAQKDQQNLDLETELQATKQDNQKLRAELTKLNPPPTEPALFNLALADGKITSIFPGETRLYINRGGADQILLGMTFEVFDVPELVKLDAVSADQRGKATIEVIEVYEKTSLARIVRRSLGDAPDEGDQIVNLVYDPTAVYKFHVYGEFDIDRSGAPSITDRRRIEGMISQWGGLQMDQLSYDVDFLVLGKEPPLPEPPDPNEIDPVKIARHVDDMKRFETYQTLVAGAKVLNIPVVNQNRFLALVGHYRR